MISTFFVVSDFFPALAFLMLLAIFVVSAFFHGFQCLLVKQPIGILQMNFVCLVVLNYSGAGL